MFAPIYEVHQVVVSASETLMRSDILAERDVRTLLCESTISRNRLAFFPLVGRVMRCHGTKMW